MIGDIILILALTWNAIPDDRVVGYWVCYKEAADSVPFCADAGNNVELDLPLPVNPYSILIKGYEADGREGETTEIVLVPSVPTNLEVK